MTGSSQAIETQSKNKDHSSGGDIFKVSDSREAPWSSGDKFDDLLKGNMYADGAQGKEIEKSEQPEKRGGSYAGVKATSDGETSEVHHMPADSTTDLSRDDGPAIKMDKGDHRQTASCGNSKEAQEYRAKQKELIEQGKFKGALQMDIDDIHEKFGDKYDDAIDEMLAYVDKLEEEGRV